LPSALNLLLLFNPVDLFRILNLLLALPKETSEFYGIGTGVLQISYCIIALALWVILPLFITMKKDFSSLKRKN
jgi:hypothetical protein